MRTVRWGILGAARIARRRVLPAMRRAGRTEITAIAIVVFGAGALVALLEWARGRLVR